MSFSGWNQWFRRHDSYAREMANSTGGIKLFRCENLVGATVEMIIPIRCMNCGKAIADKWRYYQDQLKKAKGDQAEAPYYMDGTTVPDTPERRILDSLGLNRACCRKHFLTQKDLMDKI